MRPDLQNNIINIPISFDVVGNGNSKMRLQTKLVWALAIFVVMVLGILWTILADIGFLSFLVIPAIIVACITLFRYVVVREKFYRDKINENTEFNGAYPLKKVWGIYEVSEYYPFICKYTSGLKGVAILLERGDIIGKQENDDFYHYECITEAYNIAHKKGINMVNVDYMDTVGKDDRMQVLFDLGGLCKNKDIGDLLTAVYDHMQYNMLHYFTTHDLYFFLYNYQDDVFMEDFYSIISEFLDAAYSDYTMLDMQDLSTLTDLLFLNRDFSAKEACETVFKESKYKIDYLRVLSTEKDGSVTVLNKSTEELAALSEVTKAEKNVRKKRKKEKDENIDLFE